VIVNITTVQTTFCQSLITHLQLNRRSAFYVNLDPAAEHFEHQPDLDIRDLISVEDVMEELRYGPNGALVYCFEYLMDNLDFLTEGLDSLTDEYLIIFDMPGQIELYTHCPYLPRLVKFLSQPGALDIPHLNVLSKMDLIRPQMSKKEFKQFLVPDTTLLDDPRERARKKTSVSVDVHSADPKDKDALMSGATFQRLNAAVANLLETFSMVSYLKLECTEEDEGESVDAILSHIDHCIQFHEAQEPKELPDEEYEEPEES
jgi:GTPase SAR1 family protein